MKKFEVEELTPEGQSLNLQLERNGLSDQMWDVASDCATEYIKGIGEDYSLDFWNKVRIDHFNMIVNEMAEAVIKAHQDKLVNSLMENGL